MVKFKSIKKNFQGRKGIIKKDFEPHHEAVKNAGVYAMVAFLSINDGKRHLIDSKKIIESVCSIPFLFSRRSQDLC